MPASLLTLRLGATAARSVATRSFSTQPCAAAEKLRCVFEEYRLKKYVVPRSCRARSSRGEYLTDRSPDLFPFRFSYSRETPSRFKKELLNAVKQPDADFIEVDSLNRILINIGRQDQLLSEEEIRSLLKEVGAKDRCLKTSQLLELV